MPVDSALYAFFEVLKIFMFPGLELVLIISECIKVSALHSLPSGSHFLGLTVEVNWKPYAVVVTFAFV